MNPYSLRNILSQSPESIKDAVVAVLGLIFAAAGVNPDLIVTLGVGLVILKVLNIFYVNPAKNAAALTAFEQVRQEATAQARKRPLVAERSDSA